MRPDRFERLLADAINADGRLTAVTYAEASRDRSRYGLVLTGPGGASVDVQIVARSAVGDRYEQPEEPVTGAEQPRVDVPDPLAGGGVPMVALERYLAALARNAAPAEVEGTSVFQERESVGAVRYGAAVEYRDGSAIYLYVLRAGQARHTDYQPPETVR